MRGGNGRRGGPGLLCGPGSKSPCSLEPKGPRNQGLAASSRLSVPRRPWSRRTARRRGARRASLERRRTSPATDVTKDIIGIPSAKAPRRHAQSAMLAIRSDFRPDAPARSHRRIAQAPRRMARTAKLAQTSAAGPAPESAAPGWAAEPRRRRLFRRSPRRTHCAALSRTGGPGGWRRVSAAGVPPRRGSCGPNAGRGHAYPACRPFCGTRPRCCRKGRRSASSGKSPLPVRTTIGQSTMRGNTTSATSNPCPSGRLRSMIATPSPPISSQPVACDRECASLASVLRSCRFRCHKAARSASSSTIRQCMARACTPFSHCSGAIPPIGDETLKQPFCEVTVNGLLHVAVGMGVTGPRNVAGTTARIDFNAGSFLISWSG